MLHDILHAILHATLDTLKIFIVVYLVYLIVELAENKLSKPLSAGKKKWSPLAGAGFGLIPQCGFSVVATDLYAKKHITMGTLIAIYIATSDEALPILLSSPEKIWSVIPLLLAKFVIAVLTGLLIDKVLLKEDKKAVHSHIDTCEEFSQTSHTGCCHHEIENTSGAKTNLSHIFIHPLIHSLKICAYILVFNIVFELLIHFIGEANIVAFLASSKALAPVLAVIIGFIPNCVSSVAITELYILGGLSFGATLGGLIANAGIAYIMLFKQNKNIKENLLITATLAIVGLVSGFLFQFILPF